MEKCGNTIHRPPLKLCLFTLYDCYVWCLSWYSVVYLNLTSVLSNLAQGCLAVTQPVGGKIATLSREKFCFPSGISVPPSNTCFFRLHTNIHWKLARVRFSRFCTPRRPVLLPNTLTDIDDTSTDGVLVMQRRPLCHRQRRCLMDESADRQTDRQVGRG